MRRTIRDDIALVDTNVVRILSDIGKSEEREYYRTRLADKRLIVSFFTVHEVMWGLADSDMGPRRRAEIFADLGRYDIDFASNELIAASVQLRIACRHQPLSFQDLFIASSAVALQCPFATDDRDLAKSLANAGVPGVISRHLEDTN